MANLEATFDFTEAIKEINLLINYAKKNKNDLLKYRAFNKAALVLMCAKFEAFLESFLDEYAFIYLSCSSNKTLDSEILDHMIDNILSKIETVKNNKERRKKPIQELILLCGDTEIKPCDGFMIKAKFNVGKHGQSEVVRLLSTFGFKEFADRQSTIAFFDKFNSLNFIRNNIVHEDATPSLTHQDVQSYLDISWNFVKELDQFAINKLAVFGTEIG